ncbi:MAG: adenylate/guanylate cyclase domain-containing protein [Desulfobaccales bacterium]
MSSSPKNQSFYVRIVSSFVGLLILTVLPIVIYNYYENSRAALKASDALMTQITATVMERTGNYFLPAAILAETSARLAEIGALSCSNSEQMEFFTLGVLKSYPQISMFYFGDEKGNSIRSWRLADGRMESGFINRSVSPATNTHKYWDQGFKLVKTEISGEVDYDPRIRAWYQGAKEAGTNYWTDSYIFYSTKKPGITSASPVIDKSGKTIGVWGVDIELEEVSTFLKSLKIGKHGVVDIINAKDEVVACRNLSRLLKEEKGQLRSVRVGEAGFERLGRVSQEFRRTGGNKLTLEIDGTRYLASLSSFPPSFPARWRVSLIIPEDDFIGDAKQLMLKSLLICLVILALAIILAVLLARGISRPIKLLAEETKKIKDFHLDDKVEIRSHIKEIQFMSDAIATMKSGLQAFRRYVPAELVRQLIHTGEEARLGGQKRELTVFFSDIAGFTSIAEGLAPEELMLRLSAYFDDLTRILSSQQATVDKYIGDGIMAFWGAPLLDPEHAVHACAAALLCQERLRELNQEWRRDGKTAFTTRIGISTGETVVGNVGSSERINYTVMGDNVNLASRLEGVNKLYGTRIIVSQATYEAAADRFWLRPLGIVAVKGKSESAAIYELMGRQRTGASESLAPLCDAFTRAFRAYQARDWAAACDLLGDLSRQFPEDGPTGLYLARCRQYRDHPPGEEWSGIEYLETK